MFAAVDEQGADMVVVRKGDLEDFPKFIQCLRSKGHGATTGIVKVRLHKDDRNDGNCMQQVIHHLQKKLRETVIIKEKQGKNIVQKRIPAFNISKQATLKGAIHDHIYEYIQEKSDEERHTYLAHVTNPASYRTTHNCCTTALAAGLSSAREHFFEILDKRSPYTPELKMVNGAAQRPSVADDPILYAAGVPCTAALNIPIGDVLNMNKLGTIIDMLEEKYDGVAFPYLYSGVAHSFFCWHIEDGALASINYLFDGGSKIWFAIAPKYYGLVDHVVEGFRMDKAHTVCRAVLSDHKSVLFDPEYMRREHKVPYTMLKQDPGDFIITWPFTLHAGFNAGTNMAIAVNFADEKWIDDAMYAPVCGCKNVVNLDITPLLKIFRPNLFQDWLEASSISFPANHPRAIVQPHHLETVAVSSHEEERQKKTKVYECPKDSCKATYSEHRDRLAPHIRKAHPYEVVTLLQKLEENYPSTLKSTSSHECPVCAFKTRGSVSNLERHMKARLKNGKLPADVTAKYRQELLNINSAIKRRNKNQTARSN